MTRPGVLHVVPHLARAGGYERQAFALATEQRARLGLDTVLLTHRDGDLLGQERTPAGIVHRLRGGLQRFHPGAFWRARRREIHVVHAHALHKLGGQLVSLARRDGVPTVVKVATTDDVEVFSDPDAWARRLADDDEACAAPGAARAAGRLHLSGPGGSLGGAWRWRRTVRAAWVRLRQADAFIAPNAAVRAALRARGLPAVELPNGVDIDRFAPPTPAQRRAARARLGLPAAAFTVACVGRLSRRKDVVTVLEALAAWRTTRSSDPPPGVRVLVAGSGPQADALRERAIAAGLGREVSWLGACDDVRPVLHAADVLVHASRREGLPNAVLEAMACGLPIVLSDVPGHRELLRALDGSRAAAPFAAGDARALARALAALVDDEARRAEFGEAARRAAVRDFALERVARRTLALYRELGALVGSEPSGSESSSPRSTKDGGAPSAEPESSA